eukprot:CAMPEP_0172650310 /NCGR_PEP_ID=MMETSP1068-20121228/242228_1 /TAXON_ID=35684 /ORGANISM="Pseudopedinella elastica, Strain CCMP716" /LENGTH=192 /DNA_ID=CAMNT_0013464673 /DNA_START=2454 /DNA_END=3032 /DNA_ORIENTATION=+
MAGQRETVPVEMQPRGVLFLPFCCDWVGLNDQLAIGTQEAMRVYSARISRYRRVVVNIDGPDFKKDCSSMEASEVANMNTLKGHGLKTHRFWFEYVLLRKESAYRSIGQDQNRASQAEFQRRHKVVSGKFIFDGIVDVGTMCSRDPLAVSKTPGLSQRQQSLSGRKKWNSEALKCTLLPREAEQVSLEVAHE